MQDDEVIAITDAREVSVDDSGLKPSLRLNFIEKGAKTWPAFIFDHLLVFTASTLKAPLTDEECAFIEHADVIG